MGTKVLIRTIGCVILGHIMCDTTIFFIGRQTDVAWFIALPIMLMISTIVGLLIERPWKGTCKDPSIIRMKGPDDERI
jgi:predicted membrane protein